MRRVAAAILCSAWGIAAIADTPPGDVDGTYRMQGTARVDAAAPLGRRIEAHGDAIVRRGAGREVRLRLAALGHACELTASRADDGALSFGAGQPCVIDLADPDARGRIQATLRSGAGRLRDRHLALDLAFQLAGAVALRSDAARLLGVAGGWMPDIPVDGGATVEAEADRDESRAAQQR